MAADQVVHTPAAREAYVARHFRHNFTMMLFDAISFPLGMSFISVVTILPLFVREMTSSDLAVGLVPAINNLGILLPSIFIANFIGRLRIQKWYLFWVAVIERLPWLAMAIVVPLLGRMNPGLLLVLFFLALSVNSLAQGMSMLSYFTLYAKVIPANRRGAMWGLGGAIAGVLGLGGTWVSGQLLRRLGFPDAYALSFLFAFVILTLGILGFTRMRELPSEETPPERSTIEYLKSLPEVLRGDRTFSLFVLTQVVYGFSTMAQAFYTVYAIDRFHARPGTVALFTTTAIAANTGANLLMGFVGDRRGYKRVLEMSMASAVVAPLIAILAPSLGWMFVVFVLNSAAYVGVSLGGSNMPLEFAPRSQVSTYSAVAMTSTAPVRALAPVIGGAVAAIGYVPVFGISILAAVAGLALLALGVRDPRHAPGEAS